MWQHTEGSTPQQLSFADTHTCPIPLWVSCCSGGQHYLRRVSSISPILIHALEALCAHASPQPARCCSQLTLLPKTHTSESQAQLCQAPAPPHSLQGLPLTPGSCLPPSQPFLSLPSVFPSLQLMTSSTLLTFKGERKEMHVRNPRPSISPVHKL